jgi:hypothetical protein
MCWCADATFLDAASALAAILHRVDDSHPLGLGCVRCCARTKMRGQYREGDSPMRSRGPGIVASRQSKAASERYMTLEIVGLNEDDVEVESSRIRASRGGLRLACDRVKPT